MFEQLPPQVSAAFAALGELPSPCGRDVIRPEIEALLTQPAGPGLWAAVEAVAAHDQTLSQAGRLAAVTAMHRLRCAAHGGVYALVGNLDRGEDTHAGASGTEGGGGSRRPVANLLAAALAIPGGAGTALVTTSRRLEALPAFADAVSDGLVDHTKTAIVLDVTRQLPIQLATKVAARAVALASRRTGPQLRTTLAEYAAQLDTDWAARTAKTGRAERDVTLRPSPIPGCTRLIADLPLLDAYAVMNALNATARRAADAGARADGTPETRTVAQLRADALVGAVTGWNGTTFANPTGQPADQPSSQAASGGEGGGAQGSRGGEDSPAPWAPPVHVPTPHDLARLGEVQVVVGADTLTGANDHPASIPGAGPLDHHAARQVAERTWWRWLVVDPETGYLLHRDPTRHPPPPAEDDGWAGSSPPTPPPLPATISAAMASPGYRPGSLLRAHVESRDATCIGPFCHHSARGLQLDHTVNFDPHAQPDQPGSTTASNLGCGCRRIHNAKTHDGWTLIQPTPGRFLWIDPLGNVYHRQARPVLPNWTTTPAAAA